MQGIAQHYPTRASSPKRKAVLAAFGLAAACIGGCAQAPVAQEAHATKPVVDFASCSKPEYPAEAYAQKLQGTSTLRFLVGPDGKVVESQVMKSSGDRSLDEAARLAIAKCSFRPALVDGKPRQAWVPVQYVWTI